MVSHFNLSNPLSLPQTLMVPSLRSYYLTTTSSLTAFTPHQLLQKSRGADFSTGGPIKRAKALIPILIPLFVSAFKRAEELATAMECRCYRGDDNRTKLVKLEYRGPSHEQRYSIPSHTTVSTFFHAIWP